MPDGTPGIEGSVLLLAAEDSIYNTLPARLKVAGADLSRIVVAGYGQATLPDDLVELIREGFRDGIVLVIVDPLMAFLRTSSTHDQSVRRAMAQLRNFAEIMNTAVLLIRHLVKSDSCNALYRGSGGIGLVAAARSVFHMAYDPRDRDMRVLCHLKNNLGPLAQTLLFEPVDDHGIVRLQYRGPCDYTASDISAKRAGPGVKLAEATIFLAKLLSKGPVRQVTVEEEAVKSALAWRTIERAKAELAIVSKRRGFGPQSEVFWERP
jgi:hypothetical protein